ncbi:hypothetical protein XA39_11185 [Acinetobacter tandoii]|nr:hypothetical protein XA39_11185 [Acinetobacter tandoii]
MKSLFPTTQWIISNYYYDHSSYQEWFTQLRVCHKDHFDKYFKLSFDSESFSTSDFIDFLQQTSNRTQLKEKILALDARNVLEDFLSKFEAYSKQVPKENFESYLYAMFDTCEEVSIESSSSIFFTAQRRLFGLSFWCLESIENRQERAKLLINYINQYSNFSIIEDILIKEHKSRDNNADTLLDDLDFEQLKKDFILKLSQFCISNPDPIIKNSSFRSFMYRWIEWGNSSDTLNWFESETQDIQGILKILKTMIQSTTSYGGSYTKPHIKKYIKASTVENFLDIPRILNIIDSTDTSVLSDEEKELIDMLKKGIENRTNGKDDDLDD